MGLPLGASGESASAAITAEMAAATHYEIQATLGTWSAPISESELFDFLRKGIIGLDTRIREVETGKDFVVRDYPLLAALLRSLSNDPAGADGSTKVSSLSPGSPGLTKPIAFEEAALKADYSRDYATVARLRGCPNCKRMVSTQAAECPACGNVFRTRFDGTGDAARPFSGHVDGAPRSPSASSTATRGADMPGTFDPYAGLGDRETLVLREFARQHSAFMWWAIIGLLFSPTLFSVLLTLYATIRMNTIRQSVAELGVDPGLWNAYEGRRFWKVNKSSLMLWSFAVLCVVAAVAFTAYDLANSAAPPLPFAPDSGRSGLSSGR